MIVRNCPAGVGCVGRSLLLAKTETRDDTLLHVAADALDKAPLVLVLLEHLELLADPDEELVGEGRFEGALHDHDAGERLAAEERLVLQVLAGRLVQRRNGPEGRRARARHHHVGGVGPRRDREGRRPYALRCDVGGGRRVGEGLITGAGGDLGKEVVVLSRRQRAGDDVCPRTLRRRPLHARSRCRWEEHLDGGLLDLLAEPIKVDVEGGLLAVLLPVSEGEVDVGGGGLHEGLAAAPYSDSPCSEA